MIWCPRCDQGWVVKAHVRGRAEKFLVCKECDTVWEGTPTGAMPFLLLEDYLARFGKSPLWSNIEIEEK